MFVVTVVASCLVNFQDPNLGAQKDAKDIKEFLELKKEEERKVNYAYPFIKEQQPGSIKLRKP